MRGSIGSIGGQPMAPLLLNGSKKPEYRGYDFAGVAACGDGRIDIAKARRCNIDRPRNLAKSVTAE